MADSSEDKNSNLVRLFGILLLIVGLLLAAGGIYLITLGGSWYYLLAGIGLAVSGWWVFKGELRGIGLYLIVFVFTVLWALWETKFNFWALVPRTAAPLVLAIIALYLVPKFQGVKAPTRGIARWLATGGLAVFIADLLIMFQPHNVVQNTATPVSGQITPVTAAANTQWTDYGRTGEGVRYAPFDQINVDNVKQLEVAWTTRHGDISEVSHENQNTPLFIDGVLYHCSPSNILSAIDGETGEILWQYDSKSESPFWNRCRGVAYYNPPPIVTVNEDGTSTTTQDACGPRIVMGTIDVRLIAIRTRDGQLCESFGTNGIVDLSQGMGDIQPGFYMQTTGAMIAGDKILIGGWVADNVMVGEPSGVVRAFDALTGDFIWAWDLGDEADTGIPPEGKTFTRGTPNVWAPMSYDLELGTVYLPVGNATPDYYGAHRSPESHKYASSIVALDLTTGRVKWHYQTVHHDVWDYDVPAQPALINIPGENGQTIPAVAVLTKRGQIFLLDRRDGSLLADVEERPVPKGVIEEEEYSPTQPYSVGMPQIGAEPLSEKQTWGMTPLDHLYCRIYFKRHIYKGDFTPPSLELTLQNPGNNGGFNWGSASYDQQNNILLVNDMRMPISNRLMPRAEADAIGIDPHGTYSLQQGTPYGFYLVNFMTPWGVPCMQPPFGTLTAIDMAKREIIWQRPVGTTKDIGPFGLKFGVPFNVGMPTLGGTVTTSGGLVFLSGTQDYYLRAFDTLTGDEVWKGRLPTGGQATPVTYIDPKSGRQFIVANAGGAPHNPNDRGDYLVAFALPQKAADK